MEQKHYGLKNVVLEGEIQLFILIGRVYESILKTYA